MGNNGLRENTQEVSIKNKVNEARQVGRGQIAKSFIYPTKKCVFPNDHTGKNGLVGG